MGKKKNKESYCNLRRGRGGVAVSLCSVVSQEAAPPLPLGWGSRDSFLTQHIPGPLMDLGVGTSVGATTVAKRIAGCCVLGVLIFSPAADPYRTDPAEI